MPPATLTADSTARVVAGLCRLCASSPTRLNASDTRAWAARESRDGEREEVGYGGAVRIAALYDVHGNLPALEAVLADVAAADVDEIVVGGDVLWGPLQVECLERLRATGATFVAGNCERDVLNGTSESETWCASRLDDDTRQFVESLPLAVEREPGAVGKVLFCHATPRSNEEILTSLTPEDVVREALSETDADVVVCGHTHVQFDRAVPGAPRLVNAGSVGLPYEGAPGARWTLIGPEVEFRSSEYDVEHGIEVLAAAGFPPFDEVFPKAMRGLVTREEATAAFESRRGS
jgi:predicted phosphodiesterase